MHIPKSAQKREGFVAVQKRGQAWDISRGSASREAGAVQETSPSETLGGPGAALVAGVALGSIRASGLPR